MKNFSVLNLKLINIQRFTQSKIFLIIFFLLLLVSSYSFINSMIPVYLVCFFAILINLNKLKLSKKNIIGYLLFILFIGISLLHSNDFIFSLRIIVLMFSLKYNIRF